MTRACIRLVLSLLLAAALAPELPACASTGCLPVTRSAGGLLPRKTFRLDFSYRMTDDSQLMSGSDSATRVTRPKVDFENGIVRPGFHQDLGGRSRFMQADAAYLYRYVNETQVAPRLSLVFGMARSL